MSPGAVFDDIFSVWLDDLPTKMPIYTPKKGEGFIPEYISFNIHERKAYQEIKAGCQRCHDALNKMSSSQDNIIDAFNDYFEGRFQIVTGNCMLLAINPSHPHLCEIKTDGEIREMFISKLMCEWLEINGAKVHK